MALKGLKGVEMSLLNGPYLFYYSEEQAKKAKELADEQGKVINPVIKKRKVK